MVSPAATLDLLHPREVLEQRDGSLNKHNIEPLEAGKGSGERQERMGCNEIPQAEAGLSLDPGPCWEPAWPGLALTHVSIFSNKAPGQETHGQSCRGKDRNHQNNPKPGGFSFLNPEQSQTPSPCKLLQAQMTFEFPQPPARL